jgi:SpoIIAA-like
MEIQMIELLAESHKAAFGFKVIGKLTADDVASLSQQIDNVIAHHKKPIGILADLSEMHGATWAARWEEMRFLHRHTDHVARLAVVSDDDWQEICEMVLLTTAPLQAQMLYFHSSEILHAWHWVKMARTDESMPTRVMYPGKGLFQDYTPEYMGV